MLTTVTVLLLSGLCSGGFVLAQDQTQAQSRDQASETPLVFFYRGDELVGVERPMGEQFMEELVLELCGGPTEEEQAQGLTSAIPSGVNLMYSTKEHERRHLHRHPVRRFPATEGTTWRGPKGPWSSSTVPWDR